MRPIAYSQREPQKNYFAVIERMVKAALVISLVGGMPNARAGDRGRNRAGIVIPIRPSRPGL